MTSPGMSFKLQNIFLWFLIVSWIASRSKIILLKFDKSWNVLQASKYLSMIFKSTLDCQKVQNNLTEVWQVLECLASFKKKFYYFQKFSGLPECQKYLPSLTVSWIARRSKITFMKMDKSWNVLPTSKYFFHL